jgi:hypothetical protein
MQLAHANDYRSAETNRRYFGFCAAAARSLAWATRAAKRGSLWSDLKAESFSMPRGEVSIVRRKAVFNRVFLGGGQLS